MNTEVPQVPSGKATEGEQGETNAVRLKQDVRKIDNDYCCNRHFNTCLQHPTRLLVKPPQAIQPQH